MNSVPELSPSIHEDCVRRYTNQDDDDVLDAIVTVARTFRERMEKTRDAAGVIRANPIPHPLARELAVADVGEKNLAVAQKAIDAIQSKVAETVAEIGASVLPKKSTMAGDVLRQGEIRAAFRAMSSDEKKEAWATALRESDRETLDAILSGVPVSTGMSHDELGFRRETYSRKFFPSACRRIDGLKEAMADLERIYEISKKFVANLTDHDKVSAARNSEAAAKTIVSNLVSAA